MITNNELDRIAEKLKLSIEFSISEWIEIHRVLGGFCDDFANMMPKEVSIIRNIDKKIYDLASKYIDRIGKQRIP